MGSHAERILEPTAAGGGDVDGAAVGHAFQPAFFEEKAEERGSECSGYVRHALAPVEACRCEGPTACARRSEVEADVAEKRFSFGRQFKLSAGGM